jgi:hypothetical protein
MNVSLKNITIIFLGLLLLTGCGEVENPSQKNANVQDSNKLDGVDIKSVIQNALPDSNASYTAPDPLMIKKAFEPCKLYGEGGSMKGSCQIYADGSYLVNAEENPKHDTKVDITTSGARTMVFYIQLESKNPNGIHLALNEDDYKKVDIECTDERIGNWEFKKVSAKNKKDFVVAIDKNISASSGWGILRIYIDGTSPEKACELLAMEESVNSLAETDVTRMELQSNSKINSNDINKPQSNNSQVINSIPREYTQLFVCFSDSNYLPVANTLTETLIGYIQAGENLAYAKIIESSSSHFSGSSVRGGCNHNGFAINELPKEQGELIKFSENNRYIFWIRSTHGAAGGSYTAIAESK